MKIILLFVITVVYGIHAGRYRVAQPCVNMWDEGCINGQLPGSGILLSDWQVGVEGVRFISVLTIGSEQLKFGGDDDYLNGGFNPGKRCVNVWDEGCVNGQLNGAGGDDDYLNGGFNPGKRCVNVWDEGCINGQLNGAGGDDDYLQGGFNPGKRARALLLMHKSKSHQ